MLSNTFVQNIEYHAINFSVRLRVQMYVYMVNYRWHYKPEFVELNSLSIFKTSSSVH